MKVSVITVCKNAEQSIQQTIASVYRQSYKNIEYIVVDGLSLDTTPQVLTKNKKHISVLIRKKDNGVYQAMNTGLTKVTGDIVFFLNSGDYFADTKTVSRVVKTFMDSSADIVYGDAIVVDSKNGAKNMKRHNRWLPYYLYKNTITHQAVFAKRSVFETSGVFDESFLVLADLEWEVRTFINSSARIRYEPMAMVYYQRGGMSEAKDGVSIVIQAGERNRVRGMYYPAWQKMLFTLTMGVEYVMNEINNSTLKCYRLYKR